MLKPEYTTQELVKIIGTPTANINRRAKRESWQSKPRTGKGGGSLWVVSSMPEATYNQLVMAVAAVEATALPAMLDAPLYEMARQGETLGYEARQSLVLNNSILNEDALSGEALADDILPVEIECRELAYNPKKKFRPLHLCSSKEKEVALARKVLVTAILKLERQISRNKAIASILSQAKDGSLDENLLNVMAIANAHAKENRAAPCRRRLYSWVQDYEEFGLQGLIPKFPQKNFTPPVWLDVFLTLWQRPQKPSLAQAYDEFLDLLRLVRSDFDPKYNTLPHLPQVYKALKLAKSSGLKFLEEIPPIYTVRRWIGKMGNVDRELGRMSGNSLLALRPHKLRSTHKMLPTDWYTADGTTADVEVISPITGKPFKPEITFVFDVCTRKCVGVSLGDNENKFTVLDALRIACINFGICLAFYTDNGPGYTNTMLTAEATGILSRLNIEAKKSIPGRPQGKGLTERALKSIHERLAKRFRSSTHRDMDTDASHNAFKLSRKEIKATGSSSYLPQWQSFMIELGRCIDVYNASPHSGLPNFRDCTGRLRHYSPNEFWQNFENSGFEAVKVPVEIQDELFMPGIERPVHNGMVTLFKNKYYSYDLQQFHGDRVLVRYDIHDATRVYIWSLDGRKICNADVNANMQDYAPLSQLEVGRAKRTLQQLKRVEGKVKDILPGAQVSLPNSENLSLQMVVDSLRKTETETLQYVEVARAKPLPNKEEYKYFVLPEPTHIVQLERPIFSTEYDRYLWLMEHLLAWRPEDRAWLEYYVQSPEYADYLVFFERKNLDWKQYLEASLANNQAKNL